MRLLSGSDLTVEFADDPIASHSAQFGLARPMDVAPRRDGPSPAGARPWNLRAAATPSGSGTLPRGWRYDHDRQIAVAESGQPLREIVDATAKSVTDLDGDEGKSEDWQYDYHPDEPGMPG